MKRHPFLLSSTLAEAQAQCPPTVRTVSSGQPNPENIMKSQANLISKTRDTILCATLFASAAFAFLLTSQTASAQTRTWDGGGANSNLDTAANWVGDVAPVKGGIMEWNGTSAGTVNATLSSETFGDSGGGVQIRVRSAQTSALNISSDANGRTLRLAAPGSMIIESGAGAVTLGGANTFNLTPSHNGASPTTFTFTNNSSNTASITSVVTIATGGSSPRPITFDGTGNWNVGASISNAIASLNKSGDGTMTYSASTVNGTVGRVDVNVNAGTLLVTGTLSYSTKAVTVASSGTLGGTGTIGASTTVDGNLKPGISLGVLKFSQPLALTATANTTMEIDGTTRGTQYDGINMSANALTYGGNLTLDMGTTFGEGNYTFDLFNFSGTQTGSFANVTLDGSYTGSLVNNSGVWSLTSGVNTWTFTQSTGDLGLVVIPEPSTWALLGASLTALLVFRRRRTC